MNKNWLDIAREIFFEYKLFQSVTIKGFELVGDEQEPIPLGKLILDELDRLDKVHNTYTEPGHKIRRKRYRPQNTVGGYVAQKIFKYKQEKRDNKIIYTIWRIQ